MASKDTGQFGILSGVYCMYLSTRRGAGVMNATEDIHGHVGAGHVGLSSTHFRQTATDVLEEDIVTRHDAFIAQLLIDLRAKFRHQ